MEAALKDESTNGRIGRRDGAMAVLLQGKQRTGGSYREGIGGRGFPLTKSVSLYAGRNDPRVRRTDDPRKEEPPK